MPNIIHSNPKDDDSYRIIPKLYQLLENRKKEGNPDKSYSAKLLQQGIDAILKKIGEESTEVILAAKNDSHLELINEISDLCFHLLVLMVQQGIPLMEIELELEKRFGRSGFEEKKNRLKF